MKIARDSVVRFEYTLTGSTGMVLDQAHGEQALAYLHGHRNIIPGLEKAMLGRQPGDEFTATIAATEAYGLRDENLVFSAPRSAFPAEVELTPGRQFQVRTPEGVRTATVLEVDGETVRLDANHELAGQELVFAVRILDVRQATAGELLHGHAHGQGGYHHHHEE